jgi:RNA ligase
MNYEFPEIRTLADIQPALAGRDEFIIAERDWGYVANYMVILIDSFPSADTIEARVRREARGIKFDRNGDLLARPFQKFFNLGERDETRPENVDFDQPFDILDKLDGSMVHPVVVGDQVLWMTKMGLSDTALRAGAFATANGHDRMARELIEEGVTPIYEWMSPEDRIVVKYDQEQLVLTAVRETHSGKYLGRAGMERIASKYGVPSVGHFRGDWQGIQDFQNHVVNLEGEEGYIIRFRDGHMLKLKNLWYLRIHKIKEELAFEKNVWALVLEDRVDDILPFIDDADATRLREFADQFNRGVRTLSDRIVGMSLEMTGSTENQREYAAFVHSTSDRRIYPLLFKAREIGARNGDDIIHLVRAYLLDNSSTGPRVDSVRDLVGVNEW